MAQSNSEIKIIPARPISRDSKPRDLAQELLPARAAEAQASQSALAEDSIKSHRRDFFKAVIPASGKLLTGFLRNVGVTVATVVEETKNRQK